MNRINCNQCGARYVGQCSCPKTLRVTSGSHRIKITWLSGCFVVVSADEASVVSESQAEYLRSWPYSNYTFTPVVHSPTRVAMDELLPPGSLDRIERDYYVQASPLYDEAGCVVEVER